MVLFFYCTSSCSSRSLILRLLLSLLFYVWPFLTTRRAWKWIGGGYDGGGAAAQQIFVFSSSSSRAHQPAAGRPKTHDSLVKREKSQCSMAYCSLRRENTQSVRIKTMKTSNSDLLLKQLVSLRAPSSDAINTPWELLLRFLPTAVSNESDKSKTECVLSQQVIKKNYS